MDNLRKKNLTRYEEKLKIVKLKGLMKYPRNIEDKVIRRPTAPTH